ncbi:MAG: hypothetical protein J2P15_10115 [Micromonosporaceae bacterium]|nr:hypothetical protein [Micromonosporaceae bacterium]
MVAYAPAAHPLALVAQTLAKVRERYGEAPVHGVPAQVIVTDRQRDWLPGTAYADGSAVPALLAAARDRWQAREPAAAALAWKSYVYWLVLPAVVGYARARQVPLASAENTLVRLHVQPPFVEIGLAEPRVAVLPGDPLARHPLASVVPDQAAMLATLRRTLLDEHLSPLLDQIQDRVRLGRRTLLGSLASGVSYALARAAHALPGEVPATAAELLAALGVADLVEIGPDMAIQRRTCCLAFSLPTPKICRGCCLPG